MVMYIPPNPNSFYGLPNTLAFQLYAFLKFIIMTPSIHGSMGILSMNISSKKNDSLPGISSFPKILSN